MVSEAVQFELSFGPRPDFESRQLAYHSQDGIDFEPSVSSGFESHPVTTSTLQLSCQFFFFDITALSILSPVSGVF